MRVSRNANAPLAIFEHSGCCYHRKIGVACGGMQGHGRKFEASGLRCSSQSRSQCKIKLMVRLSASGHASISQKHVPGPIPAER